MRISLASLGVFCLAFLFSSCSNPSDQYAKMKWICYTIYGSAPQCNGNVNPNNSKFALSKYNGNIKLDCEGGGTGCQDQYEILGSMYGENVQVYRSILDTLYSKYYSDQLSRWLAPAYIGALFPYLESERPGSIDSLMNGDYRIYIMGGDSSIVIVKSPFDSLGFGNAVWVLNRDAEAYH